jgi:hypothetical protein
MAPKNAGHWNDPVFLHDLVAAFYEATMDANILNLETRSAIAARMKDKNHAITWDGIRSVLSCISSFSLRHLITHCSVQTPQALCLLHPSHLSLIHFSPLTSHLLRNTAPSTHPSLEYTSNQICFKMPRQVMKWDERVHEDILLAIFTHISFTSDQMANIMEALRAREYTFSESALR